MYFGYSEIWRFTFIPIGFVIVMATFIALCLIYAVGASRDGVSAARYLRMTMILFFAALLLDGILALASGQLVLFVNTLGPAPLLEMIVLAAMCIGSMWFMAVSYVVSKQQEGA